MYDINFFKSSNNLKQKIVNSQVSKSEFSDIIAELDFLRSKAEDL